MTFYHWKTKRIARMLSCSFLQGLCAVFLRTCVCSDGFASVCAPLSAS